MKLKGMFLVGILLICAVFAATIELTVWTHEDPNRTLLEERYIEEFQKLYPEVSVKRVTYPSAKIKETVLTAFSAGKGPDIFNMEVQDEYPYIVNRRVAPVNPAALGYKNVEEIYAAYLEGTLDPVSYQGKLYGVPLEITNWCIFVNTRYTKALGLDFENNYPKTWEELMEVSDKLTLRNGEIITRRGFDFRYPYYLTIFTPMVEQMGGYLLNKEGTEAIINPQAWVEVLTFMKEWGPSGRNLGSPTYTAARKNWNKDDGSIVMIESGLYQILRLKAENPELYESKEWMVIPWPVFENAVNHVKGNYYGHYYVVNAQSSPEKQEWAWKLIAYMLKHTGEYFEEVGLIQPTYELMESEVFKNFPYANVFMEDMSQAGCVLLHQAGPRLEQLIREAVESVMLSGVTPENAVKTLKAKATEVLEDY
ncbi:MAG TPA: extracellular solute-binding protein [Thermotogota bacterium]|jgi:multiple sugar transport system substrate-binding protein|nr:extracellular solute-binding protein [Thermotogota bacterium]NLH19449.1 extracellular solute-binding protein [Thermotogaceae bacterium]OQC30635.1 MAG: putative arabinose-binding protein precursor [Thermotogota bacterium ADurb.Bin062]HNW45850.1 extracellular solute-binding protein [Thermotogota bacterium]HNY81501.1 extracellular solute-binding protein [Thermotogota bacterium]